MSKDINVLVPKVFFKFLLCNQVVGIFLMVLLPSLKYL